MFCLQIIYSIEYYKVKYERAKFLTTTQHIFLVEIPMIFGIAQTIIFQMIHSYLHLFCLVPIFFYYPAIYQTFQVWEQKLRSIERKVPAYANYTGSLWYNCISDCPMWKFLVIGLLLPLYFVFSYLKKTRETMRRKGNSLCAFVTGAASMLLLVPGAVFLFYLSLIAILYFFFDSIFCLPYSHHIFDFWRKLFGFFEIETPSELLREDDEYSIPNLLFALVEEIKRMPSLKSLENNCKWSYESEIFYYMYFYYFFTLPIFFLIILIAIIIIFPLFMIAPFSYQGRKKYKEFCFEVFKENILLFRYLNLACFGFGREILKIYAEERRAHHATSKLMGFFWFIFSLIFGFVIFIGNIPLIFFVLISPSLSKVVVLFDSELLSLNKNRRNLIKNINYLFTGFLIPAKILWRVQTLGRLEKIFLLIPCILLGVLVVLPVWWLFFGLSLFLNIFYWESFSSTFGSINLDSLLN